MQRREFISLLGGAAASWPLVARAQSKNYVVGFLGANSPSAASHLASAFAARLRDLGWVDGRNVRIDYRWADGQTAKFRELAAEFVAAGVDVIVTTGNAPTMAVHQETKSIPIVMAASADILTTGLVRSLARPGGNVTGLTFAPDDTVGKRIELLKEATTDLKRVAVLFNPDGGNSEVGVLREIAPSLGVELVIFEF